MSLNDLSDFINEDKEININPENIDTYADISVEGFMNIISYKKKIINLVSKINRLTSNRSKINVNRIFNWIKNKKLSISKESKLSVSIENQILYGTGLFIVVISTLIWIYKLIKKDIERQENLKKKEKEFIESVRKGVDPNKKIQILSKKDMDIHIDLWRRMVDDLIKTIKDKNIIIKESPKEYVDRKYKVYLKEFGLFINEKVKNKTYIIVESNKNIINKTTTKTMAEHGYSKNDYNKYLSLYKTNFNKNNEVSYIKSIEDNIEFALNNPKHAKLMFDLGGKIQLILLKELFLTVQALKDISIN